MRLLGFQLFLASINGEMLKSHVIYLNRFLSERILLLDCCDKRVWGEGKLGLIGYSSLIKGSTKWFFKGFWVMHGRCLMSCLIGIRDVVT